MRSFGATGHPNPACYMRIFRVIIGKQPVIKVKNGCPGCYSVPESDNVSGANAGMICGKKELLHW